MLLEELKDYLSEIGFSNVRLNTEHIYLFQQYMQDKKTTFVIILFDFNQEKFTMQQFISVRHQIEENYKKDQNVQVDLLCLLYGSGQEQMRECADFCDSVWVIDASSRTLILFENQSAKFHEFYTDLEKFLTEGQEKKTAYFSLINTIIIVINVLVFLVTDRLLRKGSGELLDYGALFWPLVKEEGQYYRLFTYMFLHSGVDHILNNMLVLFFIGDNLERAVGKGKYIVIYLLSGVLAGAVSMGYDMYQGTTPVCVGASGAIFGVCGAVAYLVIINKGRLENLNKRQMILFVLLSLYGGFTSKGVDNAAHIGGLFAGVILAAVLNRKTKTRCRQEERSL